MGVTDEEKSVARQVEHARAYAARKGWAVADEHVYVDDGISGAEFARRPGFLRLMNALKPRSPFQVLVMSEESRLGREQIEVAYAFKQLSQASVRVFLYLEDCERTLDSPTDKLLMSVTAFADELERDRARQRTHDALMRKARAGYVTGGVVFGYDNRAVMAPGVDGTRSHVERVINPEQAAVVRRIFEMAAAGLGVRRIAVTLNDERVEAPLPRRHDRPRSWSPSSVQAILARVLYRGEIVWNRQRKRDQWGVKRYLDRPEHEWIRVSAPDLRIVSDELWEATHARMVATRDAYVRATKERPGGRPVAGTESKYLLTGFAACAACGGSLIVRSRDYGSQRRFSYRCAYNFQRGHTVCINALEAPMLLTDREVLVTIERAVLAPDMIERTIRRALALLAPADDELAARRAQFQQAIAALDAELARLTDALARGGDLDSLLGAIKDREGRRAHLLAEWAAFDAVRPFASADARRLEREMRARLADWTGLMERQTEHARGVLRALLVGRLVFSPHVTPTPTVYYTFTGQGSLGGLLVGTVKNGGDPGGIRTRDLDLERVASLARLDDGVSADAAWKRTECNTIPGRGERGG